MPPRTWGGWKVSQIFEVRSRIARSTYGVGNHRCKDRLCCIVGVELGNQPHGDGHFDDEYNRV